MKHVILNRTRKAFRIKNVISNTSHHSLTHLRSRPRSGSAREKDAGLPKAQKCLVLWALHINSEHQQTIIRSICVHDKLEIWLCRLLLCFLSVMNVCIFVLTPKVWIPPELSLSVVLRWNFSSDFHNIVQPSCIWSCCSAAGRRPRCVVVYLRIPAQTHFWPFFVLSSGPHLGRPFPLFCSHLLHPVFDVQPP